MDTPEMPPQGGVRGQPDQPAQLLLMQRSSSSTLSSSGMSDRISEAEETQALTRLCLQYRPFRRYPEFMIIGEA